MAHALPAFLSFFFPGFGQVVKGEIVKGIIIFVSFVLSAVSMVGIPLAIILWIWSVVDAYGHVAQASSLGSRPGTVSSAKQAVAISKKLGAQHYEHALEFANAGNLLKAEVHYKLAVTHDPGMANAHLNLSQVLLSKERITLAEASEIEVCLKQAVALYETKLDEAVNLSTAYNNLGAVELLRLDIARQNGDTAAIEVHQRKVKQLFKKATEINPSNQIAATNLKQHCT